MDGSLASLSSGGSAERRHPIFARFFDRLSRLMEYGVGVHRG